MFTTFSLLVENNRGGAEDAEDENGMAVANAIGVLTCFVTESLMQQPSLSL
jgi:hypothetical protein